MTTPGQLTRSLPGRLTGVRGSSFVIMVLLGAVGCASAPPSEAEIAYAQAMSPTVEMATTRAEELALERAPNLPIGQSQLDGGSVVTGPIYSAAGGRRCREMTIGARHRLACEDLEADVWVFVPDVYTAATNGGETSAAADQGPGPESEPVETTGDAS